jgi:hypothetical protein
MQTNFVFTSESKNTSPAGKLKRSLSMSNESAFCLPKKKVCVPQPARRAQSETICRKLDLVDELCDWSDLHDFIGAIAVPPLPKLDRTDSSIQRTVVRPTTPSVVIIDGYSSITISDTLSLDRRLNVITPSIVSSYKTEEKPPMSTSTSSSDHLFCNFSSICSDMEKFSMNFMTVSTNGLHNTTRRVQVPLNSLLSLL